MNRPNNPPIVTNAANTLLFAVMRQAFPCPTLNSIIHIHNGKGLKAEDRESDGTEVVFGSGGRVGTHIERMHPGPFVVIGRKGSAGKITYAANGGWVTDTAYFATPLSSTELDCKFLFYALKALNFNDDIITTAIPGINRSAIYVHSIPLPSVAIQAAVVRFLDATQSRPAGAELPPLPIPLSGHQRVVAKIEELAASIHAAQVLRKGASEEAEMLSRATIEAVYTHLASTYGTLRLADACTTITDGDHNTPSFGEDGVRFIFVGNVSSGKLHFTHSKRVTSEYFRALRPQHVPRRGDILYSAVGATLGVPAIVDSDEPFCFQRHIAILKPDAATLDTRFGWYMLQSGTVFANAWSRTTGSAQPTVPLRAIRELLIPLPSLAEQRRVVDELDGLQAEVNGLRSLQADTAGELDGLLPAVLSKAFAGEL